MPYVKRTAICEGEEGVIAIDFGFDDKKVFDRKSMTPRFVFKLG